MVFTIKMVVKTNAFKTMGVSTFDFVRLIVNQPFVVDYMAENMSWSWKCEMLVSVDLRSPDQVDKFGCVFYGVNMYMIFAKFELAGEHVRLVLFRLMRSNYLNPQRKSIRISMSESVVVSGFLQNGQVVLNFYSIPREGYGQGTIDSVDLCAAKQADVYMNQFSLVKIDVPRDKPGQIRYLRVEGYRLHLVVDGNLFHFGIEDILTVEILKKRVDSKKLRLVIKVITDAFENANREQELDLVSLNKVRHRQDSGGSPKLDRVRDGWNLDPQGQEEPAISWPTQPATTKENRHMALHHQNGKYTFIPDNRLTVAICDQLKEKERINYWLQVEVWNFDEYFYEHHPGCREIDQFSKALDGMSRSVFGTDQSLVGAIMDWITEIAGWLISERDDSGHDIGGGDGAVGYFCAQDNQTVSALNLIIKTGILKVAVGLIDCGVLGVGGPTWLVNHPMTRLVGRLTDRFLPGEFGLKFGQTVFQTLEVGFLVFELPFESQLTVLFLLGRIFVQNDNVLKPCDCSVLRHNDLLKGPNQFREDQVLGSVGSFLEHESLFFDCGQPPLNCRFLIARRSVLGL
jgi:hypothetical protein